MRLAVEEWKGAGATPAHASGEQPDAALDAALASLSWLPYRSGFGLTLDAAIRGARSLLEAAAAKDDDQGRTLLARLDDRVVGGLTVTRHPFESRIFGIPVARTGFAFVAAGPGPEADSAAEALLDAGSSVCAAWGCAHWSVLVAGDDATLARAAIRRGWILADSTLDYTWDVEREDVRAGRCDEDVVVRVGTPEDAGVLAEMARETYTTSIPTRYVTDPHIPLEATGRLYAEWAERACRGEFADRVAVAEVDGRIVGFDMLKLDPALSEALGIGVGRKGIAAVNRASRGKGTTSCMEAFLNGWQREQGGRFNSGRVLFNNLRMQRALAKVGGVVTGAYHTFHAWPGSGPADTGGGGRAP